MEYCSAFLFMIDLCNQFLKSALVIFTSKELPFFFCESDDVCTMSKWQWLEKPTNSWWTKTFHPTLIHNITTEEKTVKYFIQQGKNQKSFKRRNENMILKVWEDNGSTAIYLREKITLQHTGN